MQLSGGSGARLLVEMLGAPLASYGRTLKTCSDQNGSAAIRCAVADLPLGHILRARGAKVETWREEGRQQF